MNMKSRSPCKAISNTIGEEKLKIIIRIRPILNQEDSTPFVTLENNDTIQIKRPGNHSFMRFNNILPPESSQKDVFALVQDSIQQFLLGVNTTIFAYGQTGAGKTYSMIGNYSSNESHQNLFHFLSSKERGVLSRALELIMGNLSRQSNCKVFVSFFEIYNEKIFDLYNNNLIPLDIRESKNGDISIPQLVNVQVVKMEEAIQFLLIGLKNRATGSTHANAKSSRSHSIFQITLHRNDCQVSSLRIVDLAGSQKFKIPSDLSPTEKETRIQQLTSINGSLSCLGHCISALIEKSRTHIPFRNSKLTRILSESLLGQGKMRFIICISPSLSAHAETFSTLQFANRAKKAIFERIELKTSSFVKKNSEADQITALEKQLSREIEARTIAEARVIQLTKENSFLKNQNERIIKELRENRANNNIQQSKSIDKDHKTSRMSYYDQDKENDFKEQMLKLKIFQKNHINQSALTPPTNDFSKHYNHSNSKSQINKKKADFEKKIKKFIETDSPEKPEPQRKTLKQYSFDEPSIDILTMQNENQLWDVQRDESAEFIQKACTKMNMVEFNELKCEMERAKQQLMNLRKKDNELQQRKACLR